MWPINLRSITLIKLQSRVTLIRNEYSACSKINLGHSSVQNAKKLDFFTNRMHHACTEATIWWLFINRFPYTIDNDIAKQAKPKHKFNYTRLLMFSTEVTSIKLSNWINGVNTFRIVKCNWWKVYENRSNWKHLSEKRTRLSKWSHWIWSVNVTTVARNLRYLWIFISMKM